MSYHGCNGLLVDYGDCAIAMLLCAVAALTYVLCPCGCDAGPAKAAGDLLPCTACVTAYVTAVQLLCSAASTIKHTSPNDPDTISKKMTYLDFCR